MKLNEIRKLSLVESTIPKSAKDIPLWSVLTAKETISVTPQDSKNKKKVTFKKGQEFSVTGKSDSKNLIQFDRGGKANLSIGWWFTFDNIMKHFDVEINEPKNTKKKSSKEQYNDLPPESKKVVDEVVALWKKSGQKAASDKFDELIRKNKMVNWEVSVLSQIIRDLATGK